MIFFNKNNLHFNAAIPLSILVHGAYAAEAAQDGEAFRDEGGEGGFSDAEEAYAFWWDAAAERAPCCGLWERACFC